MNIKKCITADCITIFYACTEGTASATISRIDDNNTWFFNRLIVRKEIRGRGIATVLMKELIPILDSKEINLINEINPYGDLDYDDLVKFYSKFGFQMSNKGYMYYGKEVQIS